jgi:outer membrane protein assembly factor BamB
MKSFRAPSRPLSPASRRFVLPALSLAILFMARATKARAEWPQWRGPERTGVFKGPTWPADFSKLEPAWEVPLSASYSGPVISEKLVFTTESVDKRLERVHAIDRSTGKTVWTAGWEGYQGVPFFASRNGDWIRSTPAWDGKDLFVAGMRDVLVSLDGGTGKENWRLDFVSEFKKPAPGFGFVCSPLLDGKFLYVQAGGAFCKLEKATGKVVWRTLEEKGGAMDSAFSSPILTKINGEPQLLVQTREKLCGVEPSTGKVLWSQVIKAFRGMNIQTPVIQGNRLFTSAYQGTSQAWDLSDSAGSPGVTMAWEEKAEGYMSTPVVVAGKVFMHLRNKKFTCLDLATGKQDWVTDRKFGEYWSLITQGTRLLALDEKGMLYLIQADPAEFKLLAEKKISDSETWAHVAMDGDLIVIRSLDKLQAFHWK